MAAKNNESRFREGVQVCPDWAAISREFDQLPKPVLRRDEEGMSFTKDGFSEDTKERVTPLHPQLIPPLQNPRLSSQQGVFLPNGAQDLTFETSLEFMMQDVEQQWYRRFRVPEDALGKVEEQLFQFNIHDLSLFPDIEGLAGFVRQKIRLHW
jgi:hypothetical protein